MSKGKHSEAEMIGALKCPFRRIDDTYVFNAASGLYEPQSYISRNERSNEKNNFFSFGRVYKAGTLLLLAGTVFFTARQWKETKRAADAANQSAYAAKSAADTAAATLKDSQQSFIINQRPYLILDGPPKFVGTLAPDMPIEANITIRNIGKTPALKYLLDIRLVKFIPALKNAGGTKKFVDFISKEFANLHSKIAATKKDYAKFGTPDWLEQDLAPNATTFSTNDPISVPSEEFSKLKSVDGGVALFYVGVIDYTDSNGGTYQTECCNIFWGPTRLHGTFATATTQLNKTSPITASTSPLFPSLTGKAWGGYPDYC